MTRRCDARRHGAQRFLSGILLILVAVTGTPTASGQSAVEQITIEIDLGVQRRFDPELQIPYWEMDSSGRLRPPPFECRVELFPEAVPGAFLELKLLDENDQPVRLLLPNGNTATAAWVQRVNGNPGILVPDWRLRRPEVDAARVYKIHVRLVPDGPEAVTELFELKKR